ncbi:MAG: hypothetical protein GVY10_07140 [Verrucomicrobia bacterium]|nr:hypothetical protein [Verrucomicrobiota bacterium]
MIVLLFSSLSFICYGLGILLLPRMRLEFARYGLARMRWPTGLLEVAGAAGLLVGLRVPWIGAAAAGGLCLLMVLGFFVRLKIGDGFVRGLPALIYALINLYLLAKLLESARIY